jgi:hypothetical protein
MQKNSSFFLKTSLVVCLVLLAASITVNASLSAERTKACKNYTASLRILEKMSERLTQYAVENRQYAMKSKRTLSGDAVAFAR